MLLKSMQQHFFSALHPVFRYPVILEQFSLRPGSGGSGKYCGGDGVVRILLFRCQVVLSVLTERRSTRPYGLQGEIPFWCTACSGCSGGMMTVSFCHCCLGGEDGAMGLNLLHKGDGRVLNLGAKNSISLQPGVSLHHAKNIYILCILYMYSCLKCVF